MWGNIKTYLYNVADALDRLVNALGFGNYLMSISGRMGRAIEEGRCIFCHPICYLLGKIQTNHCARAWEFDKLLMQVQQNNEDI